MLRLLAKHYDEGNVDKFISKEVTKIILSLAESSSMIFGPSISDGLKQHIQKLLSSSEENKNAD